MVKRCRKEMEKINGSNLSLAACIYYADEMTKTSNNPQKRGGKGKLRGAEDGVPFGKQEQPSSEAKKAGWAKRKRGMELAKLILELKFKGTKDKLRKEIAKYFDCNEDEITVEQMMLFRQAEKAIQKSDTQAFKAIMERAFGQPKQDLVLGATEDVTIKITSGKK